MNLMIFGLAIAAGVAGTVSTRASRGFTRWPYVAMAVACYALATVCESWLVQRLPVGTVYAVWTGTATVLLVAIDRLVFKERTTRALLAGTALVLIGVGLLGTVVS